MAKNELVSLAFLTIKPMHTYAIGKLIDETQLECWAKISRASLYACLKKLSESGEVSVEMVQEGNYPARKVFSITPKGKERFTQELEAALSDTTEVNSTLFYLGINFFFETNIEQGLQWSEQRKNFLQQCYDSVQLNVDLYRQENYLTPLISVEAIQGNIKVALQGVDEFQRLLREESAYFDTFLTEYRNWLHNFETDS